MPERYAIYYCPETDTSLHRLGNQWLGREVETTKPLVQPVVPGLVPQRLVQLTAFPRHYGFHGTLKPPFRLKQGTTGEELKKKLSAFAIRNCAFELPPFTVALMGTFIALQPITPCHALQNLAAACVQRFDFYRAPLTPSEITKRHPHALTPSQRYHLQRWGYPYVLSDFRFHLTLTGRVADKQEKTMLLAYLRRYFQPAIQSPRRLTAISIYHQPRQKTPFTRVARYPLASC